MTEFQVFTSEVLNMIMRQDDAAVIRRYAEGVEIDPFRPYKPLPTLNLKRPPPAHRPKHEGPRGHQQ
jgi:hypothetical protein